MRGDGYTTLLGKLAIVVEHSERRNSEAHLRNEALVNHLQGIAGALPDVLKQAADNLVRQLPRPIVDSVKQGLHGSIEEYSKHLKMAGQSVHESAQALDRQLRELRRLHQLLLWKLLGGAAVCMGLLLSGGIWLASHYAAIIRDNQVSAELMRSFNAADVVRCDGRLCARIDAKGKRYGEKGEYMPVRQR